MPDTLQPYFYYDGLKKLAQELSGKEHIYLGIRPYGFHAGNKLVFMVYPLLLCEELVKLAKTPQFTFHVFLNDWEQDAFDNTVINMKVHPFNVIPKRTTFQYTFYETGQNIVDFWEPIILESVREIQKTFPETRVVSIRNSKMKPMAIMKDVVLKTINNPFLVSNVLKEVTGAAIAESPHAYCRPICQNCSGAQTDAQAVNDTIRYTCRSCQFTGEAHYEALDYWLYHKPLALPRIKEFGINLCITGADHYREGDFQTRVKLFKEYGIEVTAPKILYTPELMGDDGRTMGKSKGNLKEIPLEKLRQIVIDNPNSREVHGHG